MSLNSGNVKVVYKERGQTPLECINELKKSDPNLAFLPLTYAGRLDPLAEGILLILQGEECLKKDDYLQLEKEYELTILLGFGTDTYDLLGKIRKDLVVNSESILNEKEKLGYESKEDISLGYDSSIETIVERIIPRFVGRIKQSYPPYSSRTVNGKPLYKWARENKLNEITIPTQDVLVDSITILDDGYINGKELLQKIEKDISLIKGDFRQPEILALWFEVLKNKEEEKYRTLRLKIKCGSGVYVRAIANDIGALLGVPALALSIKRTRVGEYTLD